MVNWWKWISVVLILYGLIFGLLVPLKPGLKSIDSNSFNSSDPIVIEITGYNTRFDANAESLRAWLKTDNDYILAASHINAKGPTQLELEFQPQNALPGEGRIVTASVLVDDAIDETMILPNALFIKRDSMATQQGSWLQQRPDDLDARAGFFFPYRNILVETIRNIYYHVAIWFAMFILLLVSVVRSTQYLRTKDIHYDTQSDALVKVGIVYGVLGLVTGSLWAKFTWGTFWTTDVKLNMAAVSMLIYFGYLLLRSSIPDRERSATVSSAYSIFAYLAMIPLLFVVPRMTDSLHPGNGGNPALGGEDLDNTMRMVFYPMIIGLTLLGLWMAQIKWRIEQIILKKLGL